MQLFNRKIFVSTLIICLGFASIGSSQSVLEGHTGYVRALAFSPNGRILASGGEDRTIILWNTGNARKLRTLQGHDRPITSLAFSPDGRLLASSSVDGTIRFWDPGIGRFLSTIAGAHHRGVQSVAFSPNGRLLASGGRDNTVKLWNTGEDSLSRTFEGHTDWVLGVAFSSEGLLASASRDRTIQLWQTSEHHVRALRGHTDYVTTVAFAPTGELVSGSRDRTLRSWDPATGSLLRVFRGHTEFVNSVAVSEDGVIASASATLRWWSLAGEALGVEERDAGFRVVAFSPDGTRLASGDESGAVVLWPGSPPAGEITYNEEFLVDVGMWCSTSEPAESRVRTLHAVGDGGTDAAGDTGDFWNQKQTVFEEKTIADGIVLTVAFLNGTQKQKDRVEEVVDSWGEASELHFVFVEGNKPSDIRIRFIEPGKRSSSLLGNQATQHRGEPTMWLSPAGEKATDGLLWSSQNPDDLADKDPSLPFSGTILHEFGHALGLLHEQNSPAAILEDVFDLSLLDKIIRQEKIEEGIRTEPQLSQAVKKEKDRNYKLATTEEWQQLNYTSFDPNSIMLYGGLPLKNGNFTFGNYQLSETDKQFMGSLYPKQDLTPTEIEVTLYEGTGFSGLKTNVEKLGGNQLRVESRELKDISVRVLNKNGGLISNASVTLSASGAAEMIFSRKVLNTGNSGTEAEAQVTFKGKNVSGVLQVKVGNLTRRFDIYVEGIPTYEIEEFTRSVTLGSKRGCLSLDWYWTDPKYIDFSDVCEERISYELETSTSWFDDPFVDEEDFHGGKFQGSTTKWINSKKVKLKVFLREHCLNQTTVDVSVTVQCKNNILSAAPSLQSHLRPETDHLSTVWQDLSQVPSETALLPNYPNPFNPETWIPYHLAEPAEVTLTIYSMDGKLVRTIALGHQPAGAYESKSRAAYWDGRNATGERVASGLYFYTLTAGDFIATGKMLILK